MIWLEFGEKLTEIFPINTESWFGREYCWSLSRFFLFSLLIQVHLERFVRPGIACVTVSPFLCCLFYF